MRPARAATALVLRVAPSLTPRVKRDLWKLFYQVASTRGRDPGTALMNYGYAFPDDRTPDDPDHFGRQLYAKVAAGGDLAGKDVLDIGCGRGGGTAFVCERFRPRTMTGLDLAPSAIARCRVEHERPGLAFIAGDAESLPFPDAALDVVLSVESSHCYPSVQRFLDEVSRVLRPGGLLLLADFRHTLLPEADTLVPHEDVACLREQIASAGFRTLEEEDITDGVLRALRLDSPSRRARLEHAVPRPLRRHALAFAAVEGGPMYRAYEQRLWTYLRFALQKADSTSEGGT
jgi:SAM-dependent methyltransferase